jgi:RNA polymerase sigma-70 factor, ECF subfamily
MMETENELSIEALKAGDREAFARLVDVTSGHIYRVALQILGSSQDAEDAMQETYIKVLRSLAEFEGRSSLTTWVYRIAVNEALMLARKRRPSTFSMEGNETDDREEINSMEIVDWCCLPEEELLSGESRRFLDQAVQNLADKLRVVFVMRDLEGLSIQETAAALGVSESVVKTRLLRARLLLREELSQYYGDRLQEDKRQ